MKSKYGSEWVRWRSSYVSLRVLIAGICLIPFGCWNDDSGSGSAATARCDELPLTTIPHAEAGDVAGWWPKQAVPKGLVRAVYHGDDLLRASSAMLLQSAAGLAAKAVNDGRGDEMVWVETGNVDEEDWLARRLKRWPQVELRGTFDMWDLVERFARREIIKGYILYRSDTSRGGTNPCRAGMDCSVNVATSLAGLLDGVIVDEKLERRAREHRLKLLMDVRDKSQAWCFETYRHRFNRRIACTQDPNKPSVRDLAVAQRAFTVYGQDAPTPALMAWLEPLSPILGCNCGDEFKSTQLTSRYGHIQTATDWCINLPVLMAGTEDLRPSRQKDFDPRGIDWSDTRSAVTFVSTDGDNVQWWEGNFFRSPEGRDYWGYPDRGRMPFAWSCCFAHLAQLCPEAVDYALETRSPNDWFVEWGGGYYYPDLFARDRPDRWGLLARHARRTWELMTKSDTRIIGFDMAKVNAPDALKAYQVFAAQTDGLLGILVYQYDTNEGGAGKTFWVKDARGRQVPVVSARYSIWSHHNDRPRAGTPAKVAREIRETAAAARAGGAPRYDWVITHTWSWFRHAPGSDETAEEMPQEDAAAQGGSRCYAPAMWCAARLAPEVRVVGPEELLWRIRMHHDPEATRKLLEEYEGLGVTTTSTAE